MDKQAARELLIKAKFYRFFAIFFAIAGVGLFGLLYFNRAAKEGTEAGFVDPFVIVLLIVAFLPSAVLSLKAKSAETKLKKILNEPEIPAKKA